MQRDDLKNPVTHLTGSEHEGPQGEISPKSRPIIVNLVRRCRKIVLLRAKKDMSKTARWRKAHLTGSEHEGPQGEEISPKSRPIIVNLVRRCRKIVLLRAKKDTSKTAR